MQPSTLSKRSKVVTVDTAATTTTTTTNRNKRGNDSREDSDDDDQLSDVGVAVVLLHTRSSTRTRGKKWIYLNPTLEEMVIQQQ